MHDTMLYQGLYFDVDYDNADYNEGANMMNRLLLNASHVLSGSQGKPDKVFPRGAR